METDALLNRLRTLIASVTAESGSPVYRRLYGMQPSEVKDIRSWKEWRSLPLLTKEYLQSVPLSERSFAPWQELDAIYVSSGTTGKPPFFSARTRVAGYEYRTTSFPEPRAFLSGVGPPHRQTHWVSTLKRQVPVIALDAKRMEASVRLAKAVGVDGMFVFIHHIPLLGELMQKHEIAEGMRYVEVTGEACSAPMYKYLRGRFPNAMLVASFGATEIEDTPFAISGKGSEEALRTYTAKSGCFLELIDSETGLFVDPATGAEGELLLTTHEEERMAFPMIRYRIGDRVRVTAAEDDTWRFISLGRAEVDFIKIPGGILHAGELERVLTLFDPALTERFEAHVFEYPSPKGPSMEIVVRVTADNVDFNALTEHIGRNLHIGPTFTYDDGVAKELYRPLRCETLNDERTGKLRRIIRHQSP